MPPHKPHPELWTKFSGEKTSRDSTLLELLVWKFVSVSVPARSTNRDVVDQIVRESKIPVESLCAELNQPVYSRGQVIFGYAGDELDKIAGNYDNMRWGVSDAGLRMFLSGRRSRTIDELAVVMFTRKGDIKLLQKADGSRLYNSVDFPTAEKYADITPRRRQQLMKDGHLASTGKGQNRRITVESLIAYCPPVEDAK